VHSVSDITSAFKQLQQLADALRQTSVALAGDFSASETAVREVNGAMERVNNAVLDITGGNKELPKK